MSVHDALTRIGVELPPVVPPVAAYIPAKKHGNLVYTSGQLPMFSGELMATGTVGGTNGVSRDRAQQCARQCALNALAAAAHAAGGVDNITGVLKVTGFVASAMDFFDQAAVINGASEVLAEIFGDEGQHARAAVGVAALPLNAAVEVEVIFTTTS